MKHSNLIPLKLQFFAEGEGSGNAGNNNPPPAPQPPVFDYDKLASIVNGKQSVTEDTVLKSYFEKQGLSKDEMNQAISAFKEQKAKNTPDVTAMQSQITELQKARTQAEIDKESIAIGLELGLDIKAIPYVAKLADMSAAVDNEGKISADNIKAAMSKVLEDLPQLKPAKEQPTSGFRVGNPGGGADEAKATEEKLKNIFGLK